MRQPTAVGTARFVWLVLTFMMLVSRVIFQTAGAEWMRSFLDGWKVGRTRQVWGAVSLVVGVVVTALAEQEWSELRISDWIVVALLAAVLVADGLVNVLPSGFHTFKDRVQASWVQRHNDSDRAGDRSLFAVGNLVLALLAGGWAAIVIAYRPIDGSTLGRAAGASVVLTPLLVMIGRLEGNRRKPRSTAPRRGGMMRT